MATQFFIRLLFNSFYIYFRYIENFSKKFFIMIDIPVFYLIYNHDRGYIYLTIHKSVKFNKKKKNKIIYIKKKNDKIFIFYIFIYHIYLTFCDI